VGKKNRHSRFSGISIPTHLPLSVEANHCVIEFVGIIKAAFLIQQHGVHRAGSYATENGKSDAFLKPWTSFGCMHWTNTSTRPLCYHLRRPSRSKTLLPETMRDQHHHSGSRQARTDTAVAWKASVGRKSSVITSFSWLTMPQPRHCSLWPRNSDHASLHFSSLSNRENLTFSDANNLAVQHARGDRLLFLNNDVIPRQASLSRLDSALKNDPQAGVAGARLLFHDGHRIQHAGMAQMLWGYASNYAVGVPANDPGFNNKKKCGRLQGP